MIVMFCYYHRIYIYIHIYIYCSGYFVIFCNFISNNFTDDEDDDDVDDDSWLELS